MHKPKTIHTSRTIMSAELIEVMDFSRGDRDYIEIMNDNVFNKRTESSKKKTINYLNQLYGFDNNDIRFRVFEDYWGKIPESEKSMIALCYAINRDYLLKESVNHVKSLEYDKYVDIQKFEEIIENNHPNRYTPKTLWSTARNVAGSWKRGGYLKGGAKKIRIEKKPSYFLTSFAFLMAYLDGLRGDYLFNHPSVEFLDATNSEIMQLLKNASDRELLNYNRSGSSIAISFEKYLNELRNV